jgi:hypothetical protein
MPKFVKGSEEAKTHMAKLRAMRGKSKTLKGKGGCSSRPNRVQPAPVARPASELHARNPVADTEIIDRIPHAANVRRRNSSSQVTPRLTPRRQANQLISNTGTETVAIPLSIHDERALNDTRSNNAQRREAAYRRLGGVPQPVEGENNMLFIRGAQR